MANTKKITINFDQPLLSLTGDPFYEEQRTPAGVIQKPLTLQEFCRRTLNMHDPNLGPLSVEESGKRYDILKKIMSKTQPVSISSEEIAKIKELAPTMIWQIEIQGAAFELLP